MKDNEKDDSYKNFSSHLIIYTIKALTVCCISCWHLSNKKTINPPILLFPLQSTCTARFYFFFLFPFPLFCPSLHVSCSGFSISSFPIPILFPFSLCSLFLSFGLVFWTFDLSCICFFFFFAVGWPLWTCSFSIFLFPRYFSYILFGFLLMGFCFASCSLSFLFCILLPFHSRPFACNHFIFALVSMYIALDWKIEKRRDLCLILI